MPGLTSSVIFATASNNPRSLKTLIFVPSAIFLALASSLFDELIDSDIKTIRIDDYTGSSTFQYHISDHRPEIWKINVDVVEFSTGLVINEIMNNPVNVTDSYGEWFEVFNTGSTRSSWFDSNSV